MKIDFSYVKHNILYNSGIIVKGASYRCNFIKYKTLYDRPAPGSETVELYMFKPKSKIIGSTLLLHGLGSRNIKFFLWMGPHLASAGILTTILILPGNYTRVENNSVSGKSYLWPDINVMFRFWENAVVDILSTLDLLQQMNLWYENNCAMGYCLGGMLLSIVSAIDSRIKEKIFMTTGGHLPEIFYNSRATRFVRKLFNEGYKPDYFLHDKEKLFETYNKQLPLVQEMGLRDVLRNKEIHPLFRVDPLSYAHLLDKSKTTYIDALFDETIPIKSRALTYKSMKGAKRYIIPMTHCGWLPFEIFLAKYILFKLNITDREIIKKVLKKVKTFPFPWN